MSERITAHMQKKLPEIILCKSYRCEFHVKDFVFTEMPANMAATAVISWARVQISLSFPRAFKQLGMSLDLRKSSNFAA